MQDFMIGQRAYSERRTDTHVFFWGGPLSNWWKGHSFEAAITPVDQRHNPFLFYGPELFNCSEQYMMALKAVLFSDYEQLKLIMAEKNPKEQKSLGRGVSGFIEEVWLNNARGLMIPGIRAKFLVGELRDYLLGTGDRIIVEGSPHDQLWGVGLAWDDPLIDDPANWRGENWLGEILMTVRSELVDRQALRP